MTKKYHYEVFYSEKDKEWVGRCREFPLLCWLDETPLFALNGIIDGIRKHVEDMEKEGEPIP